MTDKSTVIGVDVGGTFTDLFFLNDSTGAIDVVKVPSTRGREAEGRDPEPPRAGALCDSTVSFLQMITTHVSETGSPAKSSTRVLSECRLRKRRVRHRTRTSP